MFSQKDIGVFEALEENLETAWLGGQWPLLPVELATIPERVVEGLRRKPDNISIGDEMCSKLAVEDIGGGFADVRKVGN